MSRPRGRPPSSPNARDRLDDGKFAVVIYERTDRPGFRVCSGFRGARAAEVAARTLEEARALRDSIWLGYQRGHLERPDPEPMTLGELADRIARRTYNSAKTARSYTQVWKQFAEHVGHARAPRRIYRLDILGFFEAVEEGKWSGRRGEKSTLASYLRTLRACFNWAREKRWLAEQPSTRPWSISENFRRKLLPRFRRRV